jgi:hypothetical protein
VSDEIIDDKGAMLRITNDEAEQLTWDRNELGKDEVDKCVVALSAGL